MAKPHYATHTIKIVIIIFTYIAACSGAIIPLCSPSSPSSSSPTRVFPSFVFVASAEPALTAINEAEQVLSGLYTPSQLQIYSAICPTGSSSCCVSSPVGLSYAESAQAEPRRYEGTIDKENIIKHIKSVLSSSSGPTLPSLVSSNFSVSLSSRPLALVLFHASWCAPCQSIKAVMAQTQAIVKADRRSDVAGIRLYMVDGLSEMGLARDHFITTYPELLVYRHGQRYKYDGNVENATSLASQLTELLITPSVFAPSSRSSAEDYLSHSGALVLLHAEPALASQFTQFAHHRRHKHRFMQITDRNIANALGIPPCDLPCLSFVSASPYRVNLAKRLMTEIHQPKLFTQSAVNESLFAPGPGSALVDEFLSLCEWPVVPLASLADKARLPRPLLLVFIECEVDSASRPIFSRSVHYWRNQLLPLQSSFPGLFVALACALQYQYEIDKFRISLDDEFTAGIYGKNNERYAISGFPATVAGLGQFASAYVGGRVSRVHLSQRAEPPQPHGRVQTIVADNFDQQVMQYEGDQIIYVYSGYCDYCLEHVDPLMAGLARRLRDRPLLRVSKINGDLNDLADWPEFLLFDRYPALLFVQATDRRKPWLFRGRYEESALLAWIDRAATVSKPVKQEL